MSLNVFFKGNLRRKEVIQVFRDCPDDSLCSRTSFSEDSTSSSSDSESSVKGGFHKSGSYVISLVRLLLRLEMKGLVCLTSRTCADEVQ